MKYQKIITFIIIAAALLHSLPSCNNANENLRPNILWLTSEDNSSDWIGCYGNPYAETPNIDQLAREGFQYMHTYANAPVCAPQRSTWITGIMSISMGTHPMRSFYGIPDSIRYYPEFLRKNGYYTGNYEKMDYNIGGRDGKECWDNPDSLDWETLKNEQPFFQVINFGKSHESRAFGDVDRTEHDPAETILPQYHPDVPDMRKNYALYHDAVKAMDADIGAALKKLEDMGLAENTIVVYVSDHGGVLPRSKRFLFRNSLQCPLVIRIPEQYKAFWPAGQPGSRIDRLVSFVDMPKTWLSISGSEVPDYMQGRVFLGPGTEPEQPYHLAFRGRTDERIDNARTLCDKQFLYIRNYMPYVPWMQHLEYLWNMKATQVWEKEVKEGRATDVQARFFAPRGWTEELYDMEKDPDCVVNLIDDPEHSETAVRMRRELRKRQLEINDAGLLPESEMVRLAAEHNTTIFELARDPDVYNVAALLDAADLALGENPDNLPELHELLKSKNPGLRYWGIVGCFLLNDREGGLTAIRDESHEVRAMAAWLLIRTGEKEKGLSCIADLMEQDSYAMLTLLNMVEWTGETGRELMPVVMQQEFKEEYKNQYKYPIRMKEHLIDLFGE